MKKLIFVLTFILVLSAGTMFVFAETSVDEDALSWFKERMSYRKDALKEALEDGEITQKEFDTWSDHFNYMEEFHEENGFGPGNGFGGCHGNRANGRRGFGNGMMRGFGWNN